MPNSPYEQLSVSGMTCNHCATTVSKGLKQLGLKEVHTDFASGKVSYLKSNTIGRDAIKKQLKKLGYQVVSPENPAVEQVFFTLERKFWLSLLFALPLFLHMFFPKTALINNPWLQLVLATPVAIVGFLHFGKSAYKALSVGSVHMDVLVLIGSTAAFGYSIAGLLLYGNSPLGHNYLFFETGATIITLVLLGNLMEERSVKKTTSAIEELAALKKVTTTRILKGGTSERIAADEVQVGDLLVVNTGDAVPVDGIITWGEAAIDESLVSGESLPVDKAVKDNVVAGTLLAAGSIHIQATKVGNDTLLSQIIEMVVEAQKTKPTIQRLGDQVSSVFVPVVIGIALFTFLLAHFVFGVSAQQALMNSIAVLVIACPCAMGLATPTALIAGIGRAAKNGVLIQSGKTLETFAQTQHLVFDKTGTLTTGAFQLEAIRTNGSVSEAQAKSIALGLEQHSSHPIAHSLVQTLGKSVTPHAFERVSEEKGFGVTGTDNNGDTYFIGRSKTESQGDENAIVLYKNSLAIASFHIGDALKAGAKETIDYFNKQKIKTVLLSGDRTAACKTLSDQLNFSAYYAEQTPAEKLKVIQELQKHGVTAMVGDGINDAPSLAQSDVGVSLSNATSSAIRSAQIVLLGKQDIFALKFAFLISKHTLLTIKQNLFWAFFYNVAAIPIAALGFLNPMVAALAMAFSDIIVIGNSIRLKSKKIT